MGCCDGFNPNYYDPTAPEYQKPFVQNILSCAGCTNYGTWTDHQLNIQPINTTPVIIISRKTRNGMLLK